MVASYDSGQAKKERIRRAQLKESRKIDGEKYPALAKYADPISYPARDIVGREAERDEILSAMMRPELSSVILLAPAGTGKALADSTMIAVNDARGYVPMKALRVGDQVFGRDGLPTSVVGVFPQGRQHLFTVVTDGGEVRCNDEHIWTVFDKLRGVEITKTLAELMSMGMEIDGRPRFAVPAAEGVRRGLYDKQVRDWPAKVMFGTKRLPEWITVQTLGYRLSLVEHVADKYRLVPCGRDHVQVEVEDTEARKRLLALLASTGEQVRLNGSRIKWRIVKADYVDIVKVRNNNQKTLMTCIKVAAEDGLFQATENHIVTHNTALTQSVMVADPERVYLEVDPTRLAVGEDAETQMGRRLKEMFEQAEQYAREEDTELVMFMDEFHQIVQLSSSAVESIKPVLADAGTRGIRVIAATTFEEYNKYIKANQPLAQRLQPIRLNQPDKKTTVKILRGFAERHGVAGQFPNDDILTQIVEYTDRYMESATQPRKSIIILDAMIGKHRFTGRPLDMKLLTDTIATTTGMNLAFQVDGTKLKEQMDAKVYSQDLATSVLNRRLQLCVADLNNKSKPMLSVLFVGSTGVGKLLGKNVPVPVCDPNNGVHWKAHGDLVPGDRVFDREGHPTEVLGVFPQKLQDMYRVTLADGRTLDTGGPHLWGVYTAKMRANKNSGKKVDFKVMSTLEILESGVVRSYPGSTREHMKYFIPMNEAVQWPEQDYDLDPYVLGVTIGNGSLLKSPFMISSADEYTVQRVADSLGGELHKEYVGNDYADYSWSFLTGEKTSDGRSKHFQTKDVLASVPELIKCYSRDRRIPARYMHGSVEQRWELVRGLFDTDGTIDPTTGRFNVSYSTFSKGLAEDIQQLLYSLGVSSSLNEWVRSRQKDDGTEREMVEYDVHVKIGNDEKERFFSLPRKRDIAKQAIMETSDRERVKKFDMVGIKSIEKLPEKEESSCIYVDNDEHLYQAGQFVVTHNTELTKQLANLMFGDDRERLIRFDMTEFSTENTLDVFRKELAQKVGNVGHAVLLFDEVEKANKVIVRLLLQILDDGRLSDEYGRQVSFLNTYIVMTTNAGADVFKDIAQFSSSDTGDGQALEDYMKLINRNLTEAGDFPPELLGRIDAIVPFQPLSRETKRRVVYNKLGELRENVMAKHGTELIIDPNVLQYLVDDLDSDKAEEGGARGSTRVMEAEIATEIATFINENPNIKQISVSMVGDLLSDNKFLRKTRAHPVVRPTIS